MWNVSGVTGAAPIWMEMMDFLHRDVPSIKREDLSGLVRKKIEFSRGIAASREEWFIRGQNPIYRIREQGIQPKDTLPSLRDSAGLGSGYPSRASKSLLCLSGS